MAKVRLTGFKKPVEISKEKANKLREVINDEDIPKNKRLDVQGMNVQKKDVGAIIIQQERTTQAEDDSNKIQNKSTEKIKEELGDFRQAYRKHEAKELDIYNGLGVMDTGIHDWLKEKKVISDNGIDPELYRRFSHHRQLLEEYRARREYAEKKDEEYHDKMAEQNYD